MQRSQWPIHIGTLYTLVKIVEDIIDKCLFGSSTNVEPTNVERYKPKTAKRPTVPTSDQPGQNWLVGTLDSTNLKWLRKENNVI